jgi:hypothetical protein
VGPHLFKQYQRHVGDPDGSQGIRRHLTIRLVPARLWGMASKLIVHPSVETKKAIKEFVEEGKWPKPGTLPVCIRLGGR